MTLRGQVAIVTGAGRGIGRAISIACAAAGVKVALVSRTQSELDAVAGEIVALGGTAMAWAADITDYPATQDMVRAVEQKLGPVSLLVNNAARFSCIGPIWEIDPDNWWEDVRVNVKGLFNSCHAIVPGMVTRRTGRIVNLFGGGVDAPLPYGTGYAVSKTGVMRLTESLARELQEYNISVIALHPGLVRTEMTEYQLESEEGRRWLPQIADRFDANADVPPSLAATAVVEIASGRFDALTGRAIWATEELDIVEQDIAQILARDLRKLTVPR